MKLVQLLQVLNNSKTFKFYGDTNSEFKGIVYRNRRPSKGKYFVLMDKSWPQRERLRYRQNVTSSEGILADAREAGFRDFIVPNYIDLPNDIADLNCFVVDQTYDFVFELARASRTAAQNVPLVAVTGSAGKSSTKSLITHLVKDNGLYDKVLSPGHGENIYTSVISHLTRAPSYDLSVLELSASCLGRFGKNDLVVDADISVITSISEAHLEYLKSLRGVAETKSKIFESTLGHGTAIINIDTPFAGLLKNRAEGQGARVVTYGEFPSADLRLIDYQPEASLVRASVFNEPCEFRLGASGRHMAINALASIAVLIVLGVRNWAEYLGALQSFSPLEGRGVETVVETEKAHRVTLIDDSYNANPASMRAALASLRERPIVPGARRIAVLGAMKELGDDVESLHESLEEAVLKADLDCVYLVGEEMKGLAQRLRDSIDLVFFKDGETIENRLRADLQSDDYVLFKASRAVGLRVLVSNLSKGP